MSKRVIGSYHVDVGIRLVHNDEERVNRGGSWDGTADLARAATRYRNIPGDRSGLLGLRLVRDGEET